MEVCNFEIAVKLKEKGFKEQCLAYYTKDSNFYYNTSYGSDVKSAFKSFNSRPNHICGKRIDAPTISQVLKWLRDEKKLYLSIEPHLTDFSSTEIMWIWDALYINSDCKFQWHDGEFGFDSYEKAAVSAIEYVIDNLI